MSQQFHEDEHFSGTIDVRLWRRIFGHARRFRRSLIGLAACGLVIAIIEALFPFVAALLIDEASVHGLTARVYVYTISYTALMVVLVACVWKLIVLAGRVATGVAFDLRKEGFARLQELSFSYFDTRSTGWLVTRITSDCSKLSSLMPWFMLDLSWGSCSILTIAAAMFLLSPSLAVVVLLIVPPLAIVSWLFQRKLIESSRRVRRTNSQITADYNECIMGVRTTKALVREQANLDEFEHRTNDMFRYSMRNALQSAVYLPIVISLGSIGVGIALWRGGVMLGEGISLGTLVAFMQYAALFYMPIQELARRFTDLQSAQAAAERVQTLLDEVPAIQDAPVSHADDDDGIDTIEFRNVSFQYKEGEPVLRGFDLTVRAGQTIALVGATGSGKSTIVSLAARFYEPTSGSILINGIDYRERSQHWLQSRLGVVLQMPHLFSGTIRENVRYGRLEATDAEIEDAAQRVNADAFIQTFPDGYDTEVGEGGGQLSTGQRQLISLARAVVADPQVFIMDEATSSVDTETERLIQSAIEAVLANRIAFVIAHRLSTIQAADVILVIEAGRIVEHGDHDSLIARRGKYWALYQRQFADSRTEALLHA